MDTKKLRQKILDLAIRGKLVPQDPNDEPASVLLERIRAEKERLIKEGKIKQSKKSAKSSDTPHYENKTPFEVPEGWEWVRLEDYLLLLSGQDYPPQKYNSDHRGIPYIIGASNIENEQLSINRWTDEPSVISTLNDVLVVCKGAGVGKIAMNNVGDVHIARQIQAIRDETGIINSKFIKLCIASNISEIIANANGLIPGLKRELLLSLIIPVAPIEEQERIVNAVEQWFTLVDTLEKETDDLSARIRQTKSKILDLAILGKLVPQDPNDEPAIELLKRINPKFTPCDNAHDTNQLPNSWCWTTLGDICELVTGSTPSKLHPEYYGGDFPFYKPTDLDAGRHVNIPSEFLTDEGKNVSRIIPVGSTAICCIGSIGKCGYIEKEGTTNQQINTAVPSKSLSPLYLYYFCNSSYFIDELSADSSAITISIVNKSKLSKMLISLPPYNEQLRIVAKIEELFAVLDEIQKSIEA